MVLLGSLILLLAVVTLAGLGGSQRPSRRLRPSARDLPVGRFAFGEIMKALIAILALTLLVVPMLAGIRRIRRLPPPEHDREQD
jgi:hypothetical protein